MNQQLKDVLMKAGQIALDEQKKLSVDNKADQSIVTNGDLAVSAYLETELKKLYPDYEIFSEENTKEKPKGDKVIVIDPIDGTESYARKEDTWSILIGFLDGKKPVGGIIYQPTEHLLVIKEVGQPLHVYRNNIERGHFTQLQSNKLKAITSHSNYGEFEYIESVLGIKEFDKMYSAALKVLKVAFGEVDYYPNFRKKCSVWDLIAPQAILEALGGRIIYENGMNWSFENPHINEKFMAVSARVKDVKL